VSRSVCEFAHKQLAIGFEYGGEKAGNGGEDAIAVYAVRVGGRNAPAVEDDENSKVEKYDGQEKAAASKASSNRDSGIVAWLRNQPRRI